MMKPSILSAGSGAVSKILSLVRRVSCLFSFSVVPKREIRAPYRFRPVRTKEGFLRDRANLSRDMRALGQDFDKIVGREAAGFPLPQKKTVDTIRTAYAKKEKTP